MIKKILILILAFNSHISSAYEKNHKSQIQNSAQAKNFLIEYCIKIIDKISNKSSKLEEIESKSYSSNKADEIKKEIIMNAKIYHYICKT